MRYFVHAENVARWSVLLLLFLLPFFFVPNAWAGVAGVKMSLAVLAAGVGMLAWALAAFYDGVLRIPKSLLLFASALVPVAYFTSALATGGCLVTCGTTSGADIALNYRRVFFKNLSILGSTMGRRAELHEILAHVSAGRLRPVVDRVLPLDRIADAHRALESREVVGKIVLTP